MWSDLSWLVPLSIVAAIISCCIILGLRPLFARYALAFPNARSTHRVPTPQGGGIAVAGSTIIVVVTAVVFVPALTGDTSLLTTVLIATIAMAALGATDDIRPLEALPRLLIQAALVLVVIIATPSELRIVSMMPLSIERSLLFVALLWFVNLVNFMDGADWMVVVEAVPVAAGVALFGLAGVLPMSATLIAFALCGAMVGFAPFNRPVARLFLGDVGSLPVGFLLGWLLLLLSSTGHLTAAILLPLYYLADATITLLRRTINGERILQAHRSHFYQRALDGGMSTYQVVGRIFVVNIALILLAALTLNTQPVFDVMALGGGCVLVGGLLFNLSRTN